MLLVASGFDRELVGVAVVISATLALLPADLAERAMVGDTGANAVGGAIGLGVVLAGDEPARLAVLGLLAALNLVGERVSFSAVIERVPALRWFDHLGRR
jgi:hypothetical protein